MEVQLNQNIDTSKYIPDNYDLESLNSTSELSFNSEFLSSNEKNSLEEDETKIINYNAKKYFLSECDYYKIHEKFNKIISILGSKRNELNYPQITVVGDQSSGKSSLLETIFDIKLPTASGTCTKCPIVIKSKKNTNLKEINYKLESDRGIEEIDEQNICGKIEDLQNKYTEDGNLVSDKEINLQIEGPDLLDITIVDLPGIIHSEKQNDINTIKKTIKNYIEQDNTLILVVNEANRDNETIQAHTLAKQADKKKNRTYTIYTKYDIFDSPEKEKKTSKKINDNDNAHAVICKAKYNGNKYDENYEYTTLKNYKIDDEKSGIKWLKKKLESEYCDLIRNNAPILEKEIEDKINKCKDKLKILGEVNKEKTEIAKDIKNIYLNEFNKNDNTELPDFHNKFIKDIIYCNKENPADKFVQENFRINNFKVPFFQGEKTFNKRLQFIRDKYLFWGNELKKKIENYLRKLFNNIKFDFIDVNSNVLIFRFTNDKLDKIMLKFEEELKKEINKERKFKTSNHYYEDSKVFNTLEKFIKQTEGVQSYSKLKNDILNLVNSYKKKTLEERQTQNIIENLNNYEEKCLFKNITDNVMSVIQNYIEEPVEELINNKLFEFIINNDSIKEDNKIKEKRLELINEISRYEECLVILKD